MKITELMDQIRKASGNTLDMLELKRRLDEVGIHLENIYQELEMSSTYADCHRDISYSEEHVPPHSHSFFELILCCTCEHVQYLLGSQRYRLQRGDVLLIPPGVSHCPLLPEEMLHPYERIVIWLNADTLLTSYQKWMKPSDTETLWTRPYLLRTAGTYWESLITEGFQRCCSESEKRYPGWEVALYSSTTLLITYLHRAILGDRRPPSSEHNELLDELLTYVEQHLKEKITISSASHHLLVSESTITHLCRKRLGISFYQYVTQQRLVVAKQLIQKGIPLGQIGEMAGFCDYSAFFRAFKREYGISPKQYRSLIGSD